MSDAMTIRGDARSEVWSAIVEIRDAVRDQLGADKRDAILARQAEYVSNRSSVIRQTLHFMREQCAPAWMADCIVDIEAQVDVLDEFANMMRGTDR